MASSRRPGPVSHSYHDRIVPARTPGPLGVNDHADPDARAYSGDTPGPSGFDDGAVRLCVILPTAKGFFRSSFLDRTLCNTFPIVPCRVHRSHCRNDSRPKEDDRALVFLDEIETGDEPAKERPVHEKMAGLMQQFAEASSHGSRAALEFLNAQESFEVRRQPPYNRQSQRQANRISPPSKVWSDGKRA